MSKVHFSLHAARRMTESRQQGIVRGDVIRACNCIYSTQHLAMGESLKLWDLTAKSGRIFHIVVKRQENGLKIITVIGEDKWVEKSGVQSYRNNHNSKQRRKRFQKKARARR